MIANKLRDHQEPYNEGAWENFESKFLEKKIIPQARAPKTVPLWRWGAAAVILILLGFFVLNDSVFETEQPAQEQILLAASEESDLDKEVAPLRTESFVGEPESVENRVVPPTLAEALIQINEVQKANQQEADQQTGSVERLASIQPALIQGIDPSVSLMAVGSAIDLAMDPTPVKDDHAWLNQSDVYVANGSDNGREDKEWNDRWSMGLALSSSMTSEQLNMGGGLSVSYRLTDKLSISSGLTVSRYGVNGSGMGPLGVASADVFDGPQAPLDVSPGNKEGLMGKQNSESMPAYYTRSLRATTSNLLAMDVPIDLKLDLGKRFYTAVGVSFLGIVDEVRTYHFLEHINEPVFSGGVSSGQDLNYSIKATYVDEVAKEQPLRGTSYAGFMNFSVGHRTTLGKKLNLSFEPFFKLPVGSLSRKDLNFTNGGIRIVTGF